MLEITFDREREVGIEVLREGKQVEGFRWKGTFKVRWSFYN